jgi:hypothetical protein
LPEKSGCGPGLGSVSYVAHRRIGA